jgi:tetratricopeptide (TPR) repeat protein
VGRSLLNEARAETARRPTTALEKLSTAEALLPWDYQVAQAQSVAYRYLGEWSKANTASQRAINLAPERPASYAAKADIAVYEGDLNRAILILEEGLRHSRREVPLLYKLARYQTQQTYSEQSLENYRRLAAVEDSDIGQVRALGEVLDYRFAKARIQLAIAAELRKDAKSAFEQRKKAACLLAQRRRFHDDNPVAYLAMGDWDAGVERELRGDEEALWKRLEKDYRQRKESRLAELCVAQSKAARESRPRIEEILKEQSS